MADVEYKPATREQAKADGAKTYWTGKPCRRGHVAERYTCDYSCTRCKADDGDARKTLAQSDPDLAERMRKWSREAKSRARATPEGRRAHHLANKRYTESNRDVVRRHYRERRLSSPDFRMAAWCRSVLHKVLSRQNRRKDARCVELLGYTGAELRKHIERQFTPGMTWDKMGSDIHIDHIIPVAEFIRAGESRPSVIHALPNLRPMWARDNIIKSDKVTTLL